MTYSQQRPPERRRAALKVRRDFKQMYNLDEDKYMEVMRPCTYFSPPMAPMRRMWRTALGADAEGGGGVSRVK